MLKAEIKKIIHFQSFWILFIIFLFVNLYFKANIINHRYYTPEEYKSYISEVSYMNLQEIIDYTSMKIKMKTDLGSLEYKGFLLYDMLEISEQLIKYPEYLESIENTSITLCNSLIWGDNFSYKNIKKTSSAYLHLKGTKLKLDTSLGIEDFFHSPITEILCVFLTFICSYRIYLFDREQKIMNLLYSTYNGHKQLIIVKQFTGIIITTIIVISFNFENLLIGWKAYGLGDLSRPIQCIYGYYSCNLALSTGGFMIIYVFVKILAYLSVFSIFSLICINCQNNIYVWIITASYIGTEYILYTNISTLSYFSFFHHINIVQFLSTDDILKGYTNINILGNPCSLKSTSLITMSIIICVSILVMLASCEKDILPYKKITISFPLHSTLMIHSKLGYIIHRMFIVQKGLIVTTILSMISVGFFYSFSRGYDNTDIYYENFCNNYSGKVTQNTIDFFTEKELKYQEIKEQISVLENSDNSNSAELILLYSKLLDRTAFEKFKNRIQCIPAESEIFYDSGYERFFGYFVNNEKLIQLLIILIAVMLTVSSVPYIDCKSNMKKLLYATPDGKKGYYKYLLATVWLTSLFYTLIITIPYFIQIINKYGNQGLNANLSSLTSYSYISSNISVLTAMCIGIIIRIILVMISGSIMIIIAANNKSIVTTYCINSSVFILPILLLIILKQRS